RVYASRDNELIAFIESGFSFNLTGASSYGLKTEGGGSGLNMETYHGPALRTVSDSNFFWSGLKLYGTFWTGSNRRLATLEYNPSGYNFYRIYESGDIGTSIFNGKAFY